MKANSLWQRISTIILAILMVVPFSFINVKANTYNANYSLTQYNYYVEKQGTNWATTDIFVNFKAPASGTLTINISPTLSSNYYSFVVISGGNLAASPTTSTSKLTIGVRSQQNVQVRVQSISTQSNAHATYTMSFTGTYEDGETLSLENIEAELVTLNGKIDTTNNVLAQINTKLANLSINDYTQILNTINTSIGSVQSTIEDLPDYTTVLSSINNYLGSINTNVSDIESICSGIQSTVNNLLTTLQSIDDLIDTISWQNVSDFLGFTTDFSTYENNYGRINNKYAVFNSFYLSGQPNHLYRVRLNLESNSLSINNFKFFIYANNTLFEFKPSTLYYVKDRYYSELYFLIDNFVSLTTSGNGLLAIYITGNPYFNKHTSSNPCIFQKIPINDIEYWKLISAIQQFQFYNGNAATQQSISDQQSTNQSFETQSNQYHNLESTFQSNFDQSMNAINPGDVTNALTQFAPAVTWFTAQLGSLYNASGNMKVLFTLPLLLGLAMFFLGRGGKVFDHPERREDHNARDS